MTKEKKQTPVNENNSPSNKKGKGNMIFLTLGLLIVAGIAALAFVSNTVIAEQKSATTPNNVQTAAGTEENNTTETANAPQQTEIKEGNPVVAKIGGEEIKRSDVLMFIAQLPPQMRQQPIEQLFPMALEQTINAKILEKEASKSDISSSSDVIEQIEEAQKSIEAQKAEAEKNIIRTAYVQKIVNDGITEEALEKEYNEYKANFTSQEEVKARHILLETEADAKEAIKKLDDGANFEELAKELSTGPSGPQGGDLGYFVEGQMVPEFSDAAFALEKGAYTKTPVKTQFGFHVILLEDRRQTEAASLEEVKPYIEQELKRNVLDEKLQAWRKQLSIETYDINGDAVKSDS